MKEERKKKILYYIDEILVLSCTVIGVLISEAISLMSQGDVPTFKDIFKGWMSFILSSIIAIMVYGNLYTEFKYNDKNKPLLIKRITTAISMGIAWRTIVGMVR